MVANHKYYYKEEYDEKKLVKRIQVINIITLLISTLLTSTAGVYAGTLNEVSLITTPDKNMLQGRGLDIEELFERRYGEMAEKEELFEVQAQAPEPEKILEAQEEISEQEDEILEEQEEAPEQEEEILEEQEEAPEQEEEILEEQEQAPEQEEIYEKEEQPLEERLTGETVEVRTFNELRLAVANPGVSRVEVRAHLTRSGTGVATAIGTLNRNLIINGNGHQINFGAENGSLILGRITEGDAATIRVENASITKAGNAAIFHSPVANSAGWTLELENILELSSNMSRLAYIQHGKASFTGGTNTFNRTNVINTFIQVKDLEFRGNSQVTFNRGNAWILFSAAAVAEASITVREGSRVSITTAEGTSQAVDLRGDDANISIIEGSSLSIQTSGPGQYATNTSNNALIMSGANSKFKILEGSTFVSRITRGHKRAVSMQGENAEIIVSNSNYTASSVDGASTVLDSVNATFTLIDSTVNITSNGSALFMRGENARLAAVNSNLSINSTSIDGIVMSGNDPILNFTNSEANINTTTGRGIQLAGERAHVYFNNSEVDVKATTGRGFNFQGANGSFNINQSKLNFNATTGEFLRLTGHNPKTQFINSDILSTNSGAANGITMNGENAILKLDEGSNLELVGTGGVTENILIGNGWNNPALKIINNSQLSISTTSAATAATDQTNNAIRVSGDQAVVDVSSGSSVAINVTTGARRGLFLPGVSPTLRITDATLQVHTLTGNSILMTGNNANLTVEQASLLTTSTGAAESIQLIGNNASLRVLDPGTKVTATSNFTTDVNNQSTIRIGGLGFNERVENYLVEVGNEAILEVKANISSAMQLAANDGQFLVFDQGKLLLEGGSTNQVTSNSINANGTLRFTRSGPAATSGDHLFMIDNATMEIKKTGGNAPGIRMFGHNNRYCKVKMKKRSLKIKSTKKVQ